MSGSGISWAMYKSAPCSRQMTTSAPHHSVFTGRMPFLPPNQQRQSTGGAELCTEMTCRVKCKQAANRYKPDLNYKLWVKLSCASRCLGFLFTVLWRQNTVYHEDGYLPLTKPLVSLEDNFDVIHNESHCHSSATYVAMAGFSLEVDCFN